MSDLFIDTPQRCLKSRTTANTKQYGNSIKKSLQEDKDVEQKQENKEFEEETFSNILSLKLKKPKHWKWELSASRSSMNIALPRIILYDHQGRLLVDTNNNQQEQIIREQDLNVSKKRSKPSSKNTVKSASSRGSTSIRQLLENDFDDLCIAENYIDHTPSTIRSPVHSLEQTSVDFYTNDLADYEGKSRSSSCKEVRFNVDGNKSNGPSNTISSCSINMSGLPTPPSTSTPSTTNTQTSTSNSSGPQPKRKYRRSRSSGLSSGPSGSILERFSFNKGRFSSPEFATEERVQHAPRYYLATSKAGTLVVQKDSFSRYRRRCKTKHSSNENILSNESPNCQINDNQNIESLAYLARDTFEIKQSKKFPIRRHKSDGNVLLQEEWSSSEEEDSPRARHKCKNIRKQNQKDVVTIDSDNAILCVYELPTAR